LQGHGGEVIIGGKFDLKDKYIDPTVIFKPKLDSDLMKYEIFGPILPVIPYKNVEETIAFINSRDKPLALYYFGLNASLKEVKYFFKNKMKAITK
jgi:aldehyde dehydrogenase (NAD+)